MKSFLYQTAVIGSLVLLIVGVPGSAGAYAPLTNTQLGGAKGPFCGTTSNNSSSLHCRFGDTCEEFSDSSNGYQGNCSAGNTQGGGAENTQAPSGGGPITLPNPLGNDSDFYDLLSRFIRVLTFFAAPVISALVVYAGFLYLTGGSDPGKRTTAANVVKYGIIGFIILLLANVIVAVIRGVIGA